MGKTYLVQIRMDQNNALLIMLQLDSNPIQKACCEPYFKEAQSDELKMMHTYYNSLFHYYQLILEQTILQYPYQQLFQIDLEEVESQHQIKIFSTNQGKQLYASRTSNNILMYDRPILQRVQQTKLQSFVLGYNHWYYLLSPELILIPQTLHNFCHKLFLTLVLHTTSRNYNIECHQFFNHELAQKVSTLKVTKFVQNKNLFFIFILLKNISKLEVNIQLKFYQDLQSFLSYLGSIWAIQNQMESCIVLLERYHWRIWIAKSCQYNYSVSYHSKINFEHFYPTLNLVGQ